MSLLDLRAKGNGILDRLRAAFDRDNIRLLLSKLDRTEMSQLNVNEIQEQLENPLLM